MVVKKSDLPSILDDNSEIFLQNIGCAITHADPNAIVHIGHNQDHLVMHVFPSIEQFRQHIVLDLLGVSRLLKTKIVFSKSLAISKTVSFTIDI